MSAELLSKVNKLIALAGSPNENEARNAAFKACALIREHKLDVLMPYAYRSSPLPDLRDIWEAARAAAPRSRPSPQTDAATDQAFRAERRVIESKFAGNCRKCSRRYQVGDRVAWRKDKGAICLKCFGGDQ